MKRLLVIGGGLAGLNAAYQAKRAGAEVRLLEKADGAGGVIQSLREQGFLCETGPNTLMNRDPALQQLIADLGLAKEIVEAAPAARERFIVREGKLVAVPMSAGQFLTTPLLTVAAKLRLLAEPWAKARTKNKSGEESLADFARRRLGAEVFTYGLEPFVAGIFAGDPEKLSVRHAFPRLQAMETEHGSLARAAIQALKNRRKRSGPSPRLISFQDGLGTLPRALAKQLGESITLQCSLISLENAGSGQWEAAWKTPTAQFREKFDGVTLTVPAHALASLPLPVKLHDQLAPLANIEYPPVSVVMLGYPRHAVGHPLDGFGVLVPAVEKLFILGVLFNSTLFPGRAPAGEVLLTVFIGGARQPELAGLTDAALAATAIVDLEKLLRISGAPVFQKIVRWPLGIPQYHLNHGDKLTVMEQVERDWPGLTLAGSYRGGVSIAQCLATGADAGLRALNLSPKTGR
jgi:oxygen-dependent protoporphyrinogen oxidase